MRRKLIIFMMGTLAALSLAGCGDSLNSRQNSLKNDVKSEKITYAHRSLTAPVSKLLYGFSALEGYAANGNYDDARILSHNLYDEFHDAILPSLIEKKGKAYSQQIDQKYDELDKALAQKDRPKINRLIKENRDNIKKIAPMLGVSLLSIE